MDKNKNTKEQNDKKNYSSQKCNTIKCNTLLYTCWLLCVCFFSSRSRRLHTFQYRTKKNKRILHSVLYLFHVCVRSIYFNFFLFLLPVCTHSLAFCSRWFHCALNNDTRLIFFYTWMSSSHFSPLFPNLLLLAIAKCVCVCVNWFSTFIITIAKQCSMQKWAAFQHDLLQSHSNRNCYYCVCAFFTFKSFLAKKNFLFSFFIFCSFIFCCCFFVGCLNCWFLFDDYHWSFCVCVFFFLQNSSTVLFAVSFCWSLLPHLKRATLKTKTEK